MSVLVFHFVYVKCLLFFFLSNIILLSASYSFQNRDNGRRADHATPVYPQKLLLTSPTSSGRSVGTLRSLIQATECSVLLFPIHLSILSPLSSFPFLHPPSLSSYFSQYLFLFFTSFCLFLPFLPLSLFIFVFSLRRSSLSPHPSYSVLSLHYLSVTLLPLRLHGPWCLLNYSTTSESICNCSKLNFAGEKLSTVPVNYLILGAT
jgi:hypothetical protein